MEKFGNVISKTLLVIAVILFLFTLSVDTVQKSLTQEVVAKALEQIDTSNVVIEIDGKNTTIRDYIYKSLDVAGIDESNILKDLVYKYTKNLTNYILADVTYKYINNEKMVINSNYSEMDYIKRFLNQTQKEKLDQTINKINTKLFTYMDKVAEKYPEIKFVKKVNAINSKDLYIITIILVVTSIILPKDKLKSIKRSANTGLANIVLLLVTGFVYKLLAPKLVNIKQYGNIFYILGNNMFERSYYIWKILVIITMILYLIYFGIKAISKVIVNKEK